MGETPNPKVFRPEVLRALLDEMQFWNPILEEHSCLIRSSLDWTEDQAFDEAQQYSAFYRKLVNGIRHTTPNANPQFNTVLFRRSNNLAGGLREFLFELETGIRDCRIKATLPVEAIEHLRMELDYFHAKLNGSGGVSLLTRQNMEFLVSGSLRPRMLLEKLDSPENTVIIRGELLFWLKISTGHTAFLADRFRPREQLQFAQEVILFEESFDRLYRKIHQNPDQTVSEADTRVAWELNQNWMNYLSELNRLLNSCQIPGRQTNYWPALGMHIYREQSYFQSVLQILIPGIQLTE
ncbi:MAG TPA: DUF2935 domain-containing protein [Bacillota bacterium]